MNSKRACKQCGEYVRDFIKLPAGVFCNISEAMQYAKAKQIKTVRTKQTREERKKHREDKARVKPVSKLLTEAQAVINKYVRLRDSGLGCVSCDKPASWHGQWHASHFHSRGRSSALRFNLWNIHKSCSVCNSHLSGNLREYQPELINRIGEDRFNWMTAKAGDTTRYDPEYLRRLKKVFAKRCRILEKRLGDD